MIRPLSATAFPAKENSNAIDAMTVAGESRMPSSLPMSGNWKVLSVVDCATQVQGARPPVRLWLRRWDQ